MHVIQISQYKKIYEPVCTSCSKQLFIYDALCCKCKVKWSAAGSVDCLECDLYVSISSRSYGVGFGKGGGGMWQNIIHVFPSTSFFTSPFPRILPALEFFRVHHILYYIYWYSETSWNFINLLYNPQFLYVLLSF